MTSFSPRRMRVARLAAGLSPEHVAIAVERSSYSVREWERGRIIPPTAIVGRLASVLGCPVGSLFEEGPGGDAG